MTEKKTFLLLLVGIAILAGIAIVISVGKQNSLPLDLAPSTGKIVVNESGEEMYGDEVLAGFVPGTSVRRIQEIVSNENMQIIGHIPNLNVYQLRIPSGSTASDVKKADKALQAYPEVEYAEPNYVIRIQE